MEPSPQTTGSKHCTRCDEDKPFNEFGANKSRADGLQAWCKECRREVAREARRETDRETALAFSQRRGVTSERTTRITFPPET